MTMLFAFGQGRTVESHSMPLPQPLQRAIAARDKAVKPFHLAIESLDVSWTIVEGDLRELLSTIDVFDTNDQAKAVALWHQSPPVKHRYHLDIVRRFHNFLGAAVAHLDHSRRAAALLRRLAQTAIGRTVKGTIV